MKKTRRRSDCPISFALDIFGDKWSLLIVRDLLIAKKKTYVEFLKSDEGIATNILASKLRSLEKAKIIKKMPNRNDRRRGSYVLTEKGLDLAPILMEMMSWNAKHDPDTIASKDFIAQARKSASAMARNAKKNSSLC